MDHFDISFAIWKLSRSRELTKPTLLDPDHFPGSLPFDVALVALLDVLFDVALVALLDVLLDMVLVALLAVLFGVS